MNPCHIPKRSALKEELKKSSGLRSCSNQDKRGYLIFINLPLQLFGIARFYLCNKLKR